MVQYIVTPWQNQAELLQVRRQLYPERFGITKRSRQRNEKEAGGKHAAMWMFRGGCPHLVESTTLLVAAQLGDTMSSSLADVTALCAYITAFNRFITGLLDNEQKGGHKMSMYQLAENVGLPDSFVELRHQATHEELPSMKQMRTFSKRALDWIWDNYWVHLGDEEATDANETSTASNSALAADSTGAVFGTAEDDDECVEELRRYVEDTADSASRPEAPSDEDKAKMASCVETWGEARVSLTLYSLVYEPRTADGRKRLLRSVRLAGITRELGTSKPQTPVVPVTMEDVKSGAAIADVKRLAEELTEAIQTKKQRQDVASNEREEAGAENGEDVDMEEEEEEFATKPKWKLWEGTWESRPAGIV